MRIRKEVYLVLAVLLILVLFVVFRPKTGSKIEGTNLSDIEIKFGSSENTIRFGENDVVALSSPAGIFLIADGNVVKNPDIRAIDSSSMIPQETLATIVGATVTQSDKNGDEYTMKTDTMTIVYTLGEQQAEINNKSQFLDKAPVREGKTVYLPLKQFFTYFDYSVDYTNGIDFADGVYPIVPKHQQILVHKNEKEKQVVPVEEAMEKLTDEVKDAYKITFKVKYKPDTTPSDSKTPEQAKWREALTSGAKVIGHNAHYYVIRLNELFFVDKYNKVIYKFTETDNSYKYVRFNKEALDALVDAPQQ